MEETKNLYSLSYQNLLDITKHKINKGWIYDDKFIFFSFDLGDDDVNNAFLKYPIRLDAMYMLMCIDIEKETSIKCDLKDCILTSNSIFYSRPGAILEMGTPVKGKGWGILCNPNFKSNLNLSIQNLLPHFTELKQESVLYISQDKTDILNNMLCMLSRLIDDTNTCYYHELVKAQIALFSYEFLSILSESVKAREKESNKVKREEVYFKQFISLLSEYHQKERSVTFYAEKMKVAPKYLSTIIKKVTMRTPSDWIDNMVIVEAKNMLKYSDLNIQEIANNMNFPNQSFFGKYFKQRTGMTPSEYRDKI